MPDSSTLPSGAHRHGAPDTLPTFSSPPLQSARPPRCPPFVEITSSDQLLPYLEHVARREYNHGLNACWDLKPGERVAGFIYIGTAKDALEERPRPDLDKIVTRF